jgi:hypothetical protein
VAPWDLYEQPVWWQHWAITAESAESEAQAEMAKQQES